MRNIDSATHVRGESIYLDDIPVISGTLYAAVYDSPVAHGKIKSLDLTSAQASEGVVRILTYKDIPGQNEIGGIVQDEPLLAEGYVHFCGMPIALIIATSQELAYAAVKKIKCEIENLPVITDPREAKEKGHLIVPPRTFKLGDTGSAFSKCEFVFSGKAETNGQEHLYIETQGAYAIPQENNFIKIYSSTQGPTAVQRCCARVLGYPMHQVEVDVIRLGGGFGGKEDQANVWAALCALAVHHVRRPVKYSLHRMEDMRMTGKRNPYSSDYKIGLDKDYKIIAYEADFYQNAGASADLSPAVLERTLFHCTNSYYIPNVRVTAYCCRTNLVPNTAFRGFGGPQGMFVIESAIAHAALELNVEANLIQEANLINTGNEFPYGQKAISEATECWNKAKEIYNYDLLKNDVDEFNNKNFLTKKGVAFMPVCFGISFTKIVMNQARSLVHIYTDGSISISTGAVEMGQGVNTKILQVAAETFSIPPDRIRINTTSTARIANTSPSAASATADLNGKATEIACEMILNRLKKLAAEELNSNEAFITLKDEFVYVKGIKSELDWKKLVMMAYMNRISLSEHSHYATPGIQYDAVIEKGSPFAYHVYGTAIVTATVDCLRGRYEIDSVKVVHDSGSGKSEIIDKGQCEGGIVQGIGWMTMEEIFFDETGKLKSNALSTYKVPDIYSVPKVIDLHFLKNENDNPALMRSKAVGEPPLMYGLGAFFALRNAIIAFNPAANPPFTSPMTPEKVLMNLYSKHTVLTE